MGAQVQQSTAVSCTKIVSLQTFAAKLSSTVVAFAHRVPFRMVATAWDFQANFPWRSECCSAVVTVELQDVLLDELFVRRAAEWASDGIFTVA